MAFVATYIATASGVAYEILAPAFSLAFTVTGLRQLDKLTGALKLPFEFDGLDSLVEGLGNGSSIVTLALIVFAVALLAFTFGRRSAKKQQTVYILDFGVHKPDVR